MGPSFHMTPQSVDIKSRNKSDEYLFRNRRIIEFSSLEYTVVSAFKDFAQAFTVLFSFRGVFTMNLHEFQ